MGAVVWDGMMDSEYPTSIVGGYERHARDSVLAPVLHHSFGNYERHVHNNVPSPVLHHAHHLINYPGGTYHTLGNLAQGLTHKKTAIGEFSYWTPDSDVRETKTAYHIEMEVAGVSDKKTIKVVWQSPRTLLVEGVASRRDLTGEHESDAESVWKGNGVTTGEVKKAKAKTVEVNGKDALNRGPVAGTENGMTTTLLHDERKIGSWHRTFTLPTGCDCTTTKAKLDAGLLHILISKKDASVEDEGKLVVVE